MFSLDHMDIFNKIDTVVQVSACTFDVHVLEILGVLVFGTTIIMLHPYGNMDLLYLISTLENKQVTYIMAVLSLIKELCDIMKKRNMPPLTSIRSFCCTG
jgi:non-ribosomal peptide synthetase component F